MIFDWTNFHQQIQQLGHTEIGPEWIIEAPLGLTSRYRLEQAAFEGVWEYFEFASGLRALIVDGVWRDTVELHVLDGEYIRLNFSLSLDLDMAFSEGQIEQPSKPSWRIIGHHSGKPVVERMRAGRASRWITLCLDAPLLERWTGEQTDNLPTLVREAASTDSDKTLYHEFSLGAGFETITRDLLETSLSGPMRITYVDARCRELICLAVNHLMRSETTVDEMNLSTADITAVEAAQQVLAANLIHPPTILDLSRMVGINRTKLFYGFRSVYGMNVSDYIQDLRLNAGRRLLLETDKPLSEIAYEIGFQHQCNFSTAIKKRFNKSPRQIRREG